MTTRFDLESQITMCSMIIEDIKDLTEEVIEGEPTRDQISNVLIGLEALYDIRFRKLDRILEQLIREGAFRNEDKPVPVDLFGQPFPNKKTPFQRYVDSLPPIKDEPDIVASKPKVKKKTAKRVRK